MEFPRRTKSSAFDVASDMNLWPHTDLRLQCEDR